MRDMSVLAENTRAGTIRDGGKGGRPIPPERTSKKPRARKWVMRLSKVCELLRSVKNLGELKTMLQIIAEGGYDIWRAAWADGSELYTIEKRGRELVWIRVRDGKVVIIGQLGIINEFAVK